MVRFWRNLTFRRGALLAGHLLALGLLGSWFLQSSAVERLQQTRPKTVSLPATARLGSRVAPALEPIQSKALFHATRAFYVPPPTPTAPAEVKPPTPAYRVATVLMSARQSPMALLTDPQGKGVLKVRAGDVVAGWTVESVAPRRVTLVFHDDRVELGPKLQSASAGQGTLNTAASSAMSGSIGTNSPGLARPRLLSAGPAVGGLRVLGGGAGAVAAGAGRPSVAPRVFEPPPR